MAASKASTEALLLRRILAGLGCPQRTSTPLYEDNRAALLLADNPVHKERTKHIDMHLHSLREQVANGVVKLIQCPTNDMTADVLTKALPAPAFRRHRDVMFGQAPHSAPGQSLSLPSAPSSLSVLTNILISLYIPTLD